jgi:hypothetical protein
MSINGVYDTLRLRMRQLRPQERATRLQNMVWMMIGILQSRSVHLSRVAVKIPSGACAASITRRMSRFLDNPAVDVREWYAPLACQWLEYVGRTSGQVRLIIDGTKIGRHHQLLMVALGWRKRAIPIAWIWIDSLKGHSGIHRQEALLGYVRSLIPAQIAVSLVGDTEFETVKLIRQLESWGWSYVLRQRASTQVRWGRVWQPFESLVERPGQLRWLERTRLTRKFAHFTNLLAFWKSGEQQPWLLATNLPSFQETLKTYSYRMWIEEMFGDMKGHGFDLDSSRLGSASRLSRLTLAVALLYVWTIATASRVIKNGWRPQVDRSDRRDLSLFQIGLRFIERCISNAKFIPVALLPQPPSQLSGS